MRWRGSQSLERVGGWVGGWVGWARQVGRGDSVVHPLCPFVRGSVSQLTCAGFADGWWWGRWAALLRHALLLLLLLLPPPPLLLLLLHELLQPTVCLPDGLID